MRPYGNLGENGGGIIRTGLGKLKSSLLFRIAIILALLLIPIVLIGNNFYAGGRESLRREISNSMESRVEANIRAMEKEVERIQLLQFELINDEFLNKLAVIPDYMNKFDKSQAILLLQDRLFALKNSSVYISDVSAHIPSIDRTITAMQGAGAMAREQFDATRELARKSPGKAIYVLGGIPYIVLVHEVRDLYEGENALYSIIVELSPNELSKSLSALESSENSGSVLIDPSGEFIVRTHHYENPFLERYIDRYKSGVPGGYEKISSVGKGDDHVLVSSRFSPLLGFSLIHYIPEKSLFNNLYRYQQLFWVLIAVFLVFIIVLCFSLYRMIHRPLLALLQAFRKMEKGDLDVAVAVNSRSEFGYLLQGFNKMSRHLRELIEQVYTHKILVQRAELKQLQSQINPHFLYNSYFSLYNMIAVEDHDSAKQFASQMGSYLRYITRNSTDEVPLYEEAKHAMIYVEIQERRFRLRMKAQFGEVPESYRAVLVPRLILQPLIENAFEHAFDHIEEGGLLAISFEEADDCLLILVEDNGPNLDDERLEKLQRLLETDDSTIETTGLLNIHRRLRLKYGESSGIGVRRSRLGGLEIRLAIWKGEKEHASIADR
ncbi:sensor histidine kinase [Paenibacillus contaminans]|uniref:Two-component sensor histidine kinase n=1 Tax=Paenibacillus contaminans TaxID=450362 RepID=A0A329M9P1_9BACL|nr:histidine kinase [Paenibacillus contaminans]RAV16701.1 two-component sensor histidine kinase [Paenibacillus contaminans]